MPWRSSRRAPFPEKKMSRIAETLCAIAGLEVSLEEADRSRYTFDNSGITGERPLAVVRPQTVPALVGLVRQAPVLGIRLQPVSSSGEHHRGDTLCTAGSVIVDL